MTREELIDFITQNIPPGAIVKLPMRGCSCCESNHIYRAAQVNELKSGAILLQGSDDRPGEHVSIYDDDRTDEEK